MATEKRLIDANALQLLLLPIATGLEKEYGSLGGAVSGVMKHIDNAPTVDAVEVSRLGKLGKMMIPYLGCPRGMIGPRGEDGEAKNRKFEILELDPITDIDGNRWVPVLDRDLSTLKDKAQNIVEVVRCKDCFANGCCSVQIDLDMGDEGYCPKGRKEN